MCIQSGRLRKFTLFDSISDEFIRDVCPRLQTIFLSREDRLIVEGESEFSVYLLDDGVLEVCTRSLGHVCTLRAGAVVGEMAYFMGCSCRTATVYTKDGGIVFEVNVVLLRNFCLKFPRFKHSMRLLAAARLQRLRELSSSRQLAGVVSQAHHPEPHRFRVTSAQDVLRKLRANVTLDPVDETRSVDDFMLEPGSSSGSSSSGLIRFPMLQLSSAQPGLVHLKMSDAAVGMKAAAAAATDGGSAAANRSPRRRSTAAEPPIDTHTSTSPPWTRAGAEEPTIAEVVGSYPHDPGSPGATALRAVESPVAEPRSARFARDSALPLNREERLNPPVNPPILQELSARMTRLEESVLRIEWHLLNSVQISHSTPARGIRQRGREHRTQVDV